MVQMTQIWSILLWTFSIAIAEGCQPIYFKEGVPVIYFTSPNTGRCLNVVPSQSEWYGAVTSCRERNGDLATIGNKEEEYQLYEIVKNNEYLQNWTYWINASHSNESDIYFKVQRNMDQILYVPYGVPMIKKGFICEYDLLNPDRRVSLYSHEPSLLQFLGCYLGFTAVLLCGTIGMVAYINNRRKKAYENYYGMSY